MPPVILVMDDDEDVRLIYQWYLSKLGFSVEFADDGVDLIGRVQERIADTPPFAAYVLDLNIPGRMGGREAVSRLREIDPSAIVIVASGSDDDPVMTNFRSYGFSGKLLKPFRIDECRALFHSLGLIPPSEVL
ncbi:MAG: hypothetical protein Fur0034_13920 [Desulfuromonadia bacterium]